MVHNSMISDSFYEMTAREKITSIVNPKSFIEILEPGSIGLSHHLDSLGIPGSFDDGVVIGKAQIDGKKVYIASQEGQFMGGSVGEIHGAKIVGLLLKAAKDKPDAVILMIDSGGVRLHEANAGLIAISEIMRAMLYVRQMGIPVISMIGSTCGAFGGMGIVACLSSSILMTELGRLALSGPEVIETVKGVEEFDSKDRALVWRVTGGKNRYVLKQIDQLVEDDPVEIRHEIIQLLTNHIELNNLEYLLQNQSKLEKQYELWFGNKDSLDIWEKMGIENPQSIPLLSVKEVTKLLDR